MSSIAIYYNNILVENRNFTQWTNDNEENEGKQ